MTIYALIVLGCVRITSLEDGEVMQMNCSWKHWNYYTTEQKCLDAAPDRGSPIHGFMYPAQSVEKSKCTPVTVN